MYHIMGSMICANYSMRHIYFGHVKPFICDYFAVIYHTLIVICSLLEYILTVTLAEIH